MSVGLQHPFPFNVELLDTPGAGEPAGSESSRVVALPGRAPSRLPDELWDGRLWVAGQMRSGACLYALARRRVPSEPVVLTVREQRILERVCRAQSHKQIALEMGLSSTTVSTCSGTALRKAGLCSREGAVWIRAALERGRVSPVSGGDDGGRWLRIHAPLDPAATERLSAAELEVALGLLDGRSYAAIAAQRHAGVRTVANQAAAVMRKLGARCRLEVVLRLVGAVPER